MDIPVSRIKSLWLRRAAIVAAYVPVVVFHVVFSLLKFSVAALIWLGLSFGEFAIKIGRSLVRFHTSAVEQWRPVQTMVDQ